MSDKIKNPTEIVPISNVADFDKQIDYQWIAKGMDGKYHVGFVYITIWGYLIKHKGKDYLICEDSIIPYTKRNMVQLNNHRGIKTLFVNPDYALDPSDENIWGTNVDEVIEKMKMRKRSDEYGT